MWRCGLTAGLDGGMHLLQLPEVSAGCCSIGNDCGQDVLTMMILPLLPVQSIARFAETSRRARRLTQHGAVWARLHARICGEPRAKDVTAQNAVRYYYAAKIRKLAIRTRNLLFSTRETMARAKDEAAALEEYIRANKKEGTGRGVAAMLVLNSVQGAQ